MAKLRRLQRKRFFPKLWLDYKPYDTLSRYDRFYISVAEDIFKVLDNDWLEVFDFEKEDIRRLACILASYFEDYINDLGIWTFFTHTNKRLYGYYLPFYDMEDYEADYLNPQDVSYLIWHWMSKINETKIYGPDALTLLEMGDAIYEIIEPMIDDAPVNPFYKTYFSIPDDIGFFDLRVKIQWMGESCYLPGGAELIFRLKTKILDLQKNSPEFFEKMPFDKLLHSIGSEFFFKQRTSFSALSTLEWFAGVIQASDQMKAAILKLSECLHSMFIYEGNDKDHWIYRQLQTNKQYRIARQSMTVEKDTPPGEIHMLQLVPWKGIWWLSGTMSSWGAASDDDQLQRARMDISVIPFHLYDEPTKEKLRRDTDESQQMFDDYFGGPMAHFKDEESMQKAIDEFMDYCNQQKVTDKQKAKKSKERYDELKKKHRSPHDQSDVNLIEWDKQKGLTLFFIPGVGNIVSQHILPLIELMEKPHPTEGDKLSLFLTLLGEATHPSTTRYLMDYYPLRNLAFPIEVSEIDVHQHVEFFMRFLDPDSFGEPIPVMRILPEYWEVEG